MSGLPWPRERFTATQGESLTRKSGLLTQRRVGILELRWMSVLVDFLRRWTHRHPAACAVRGQDPGRSPAPVSLIPPAER